MTTSYYSISSKVSGADLGIWEAGSKGEALDMLASEARAGDMRDDSELLVRDLGTCGCDECLAGRPDGCLTVDQ